MTWSPSSPVPKKVTLVTPPRNNKVVVVGSVNLDQVVVTDRFPAPGQTLLGSSLTSTIGGKGANQAVAAALAGAHTAMMGTVGRDGPGNRARTELARHGVDVTSIAVTADAPTGTAWITVAGSDNTIIVVPGANHEWSAEHEKTVDKIVSEAAVVLCQLEIPLRLVERAAHAASGLFVLNAAPSAQLPDSLIGLCDVLVVNETELADLSGQPVDAEEPHSVDRAQAALLNRGAKSVVTTLGPKGATWATATTHGSAPAPALVNVVDTTGAGDAFCGVLASRLAAGDNLADAVQWGVIAGSLSVQSPTAQDSYPNLETLAAAAATPK